MPSSYNPIMNNYLSGFARKDVPLTWLPIAIAIIFSATIIIVYSYGNKEDFWPTISIASSSFPMSRVFAVGMSLGFFLNFFYFNFLINFLELSGYNCNTLLKIIPYFSTLSFILMSCFGVKDDEVIHSLFACLGFFSLLIFSYWNYRAHKKLGILRYKRAKEILHIIVLVMFIPMVILSLMPLERKKKFGKVIHSVSENSTVLFLLIALILLLPELRSLKVRLNAFLPEECVDGFY